MNRYLLNISYIGTQFRGIQKTINKLEEPRLDTTTIQGCIELALKVLRPINEIQTVLSSRTDAGVHALHSTLHVDLQQYNSKPYDTTRITSLLNRNLDKHHLPIRLLSSQLVPDTFHCRYNAKARTYLYRIAVAKSDIAAATNSLRNANFHEYLPVEELDRCFFLQDSRFDVDSFRDGARMFLGRHDFRSFMSTSRQKNNSRDHPMFTLRVIDEISIKPGKSKAIGTNAQKAEELYTYWDIEITAKSFLYKQVRRIVGTLLSYSTGRIDKTSIYEMLTVPSKHSWLPNILLSPAFGLYLQKIHYDEKDFQFENQ